MSVNPVTPSLAEVIALSAELEQFIVANCDGIPMCCGVAVQSSHDEPPQCCGQGFDLGPELRHLIRTSAASLRDEDVWISVKDRLPDENVPVWCCSDSLHPFIGGYVYVDNEGYAWTNCYRSFYFHDGKWKADDFEWDDQYDVTHWQPLPTPPTQPAAQERQA